MTQLKIFEGTRRELLRAFLWGVLVGLTILSVMTVRAFRGHFSPEHHHGVEIPGIYWHFVDVMWIIVFFTVYII